MLDLLKQVLCGCFRADDEDPAKRPLLHPPPDGAENLPISEPAPLQEEDILAEVLRDTEDKMVNVQDPRPFLLRAPLPRQTSSQSQSRTPSPGFSQPPVFNDRHPTQSISSATSTQMAIRPPVLNVRLVTPQLGAMRRLRGNGAHGRGRDRTRATDGEPIPAAEEENVPRQQVTQLSPSDDELLSELSTDVQMALSEGFRLTDVGRVVQTWDD